MSTPRKQAALKALIALHREDTKNPQDALTSLLIDLGYHSQATHTNLAMAHWHANYYLQNHPISTLETQEYQRAA